MNSHYYVYFQCIWSGMSHLDKSFHLKSRYWNCKPAKLKLILLIVNAFVLTLHKLYLASFRTLQSFFTNNSTLPIHILISRYRNQRLQYTEIVEETPGKQTSSGSLIGYNNVIVVYSNGNCISRLISIRTCTNNRTSGEHWWICFNRVACRVADEILLLVTIRKLFAPGTGLPFVRFSIAKL